jgi:hypothetical protein
VSFNIEGGEQLAENSPFDKPTAILVPVIQLMHVQLASATSRRRSGTWERTAGQSMFLNQGIR